MRTERIINGIQQVGIGVLDAHTAFEWYKKYLGFDTILFEDVAEATLMRRYTGGKAYERYAVLAMNMQGGGGLEIWQYTNRIPMAPVHPVQLGDPGIFAVKIKCRDVGLLYTQYSKQPAVKILSPIASDPSGKRHFFIADPFGNHFQLIEHDHWFQRKKGLTGGVCGVIIGVSNMEDAVAFYEGVADYHTAWRSTAQKTSDLNDLPGAHRVSARALLSPRPQCGGPFSRLLGSSTLELVSKRGSNGSIFQGRYWGDLGFIHLCYDVCSMGTHAGMCEAQGHPLTVNSGDSFDMGEASGQFAYNEDPDGTLIEYVETHKVPVMRKLGWYLLLDGRKKSKPLPDWIVRCLGFSPRSLQLPRKQVKVIAVPPYGTAVDPELPG